MVVLATCQKQPAEVLCKKNVLKNLTKFTSVFLEILGGF